MTAVSNLLTNFHTLTFWTFKLFPWWVKIEKKDKASGKPNANGMMHACSIVLVFYYNHSAQHNTTWPKFGNPDHVEVPDCCHDPGVPERQDWNFRNINLWTVRKFAQKFLTAAMVQTSEKFAWQQLSETSFVQTMSAD